MDQQFQTKTDEQLQQALHATLGREKEALRLFRPMAHQLPFLKSNARIRILRGGNRCLGGEQLIYDPVLDRELRIDEIDEDFHVLSRDPETGELVTKRACAPFIKSYGPLYRVRLSNGETLITTLEHRVLNTNGTWISIDDAWRTKATLWCEQQRHASSSNDKLRASTHRENEPALQHSRLPPTFVATHRLVEAALNEANPVDVPVCRDASDVSLHNSANIQNVSPVASYYASRTTSPSHPSPETQYRAYLVEHPFPSIVLGRSSDLLRDAMLTAGLTGTACEVPEDCLEEQSFAGGIGDESSLRESAACQERSPLCNQDRRRSDENFWSDTAQEDRQEIPASSCLPNDGDSHDLPQSNSGISPSVLSLDGRHSCQTTQDSKSHYYLHRHHDDVRPPWEASTDQSPFPSQVDVRERIQNCSPLDDSARNEASSPICQSSPHPSIRSEVLHVAGHDVESEFHPSAAISTRIEPSRRTAYRSHWLSDDLQHTGETRSHDQAFSSSHPTEFRVGNTFRNCIINSVEYLRDDFIYDITVDDFANYYASTLTNANSGKTLTSYALTSSCATGLPLWLSDTEMLPHRFPVNRPRRIWLVGKGVAHIGQTVYRMLFTEDNGLRVIRDERTRVWRAWNPNLEYDIAYKEQCKFADPFIPPRFIKKNGFGWEDKRLNHFSQVALRDGTMIYAFTSGGDAKQGDAVDLIHIDEDIEYPEHTMEWFMRLADYKGKMFWSVYPHSNNNALRDFHTMAEEEFGKEDPIAEEFLLRFDQNEFIDKATRDQQLQVLLYAGEATYRARNLGEFTFDTSLVYPSFNQKIHTALIADEKKRDEVDRILRDRGGEPPDDWTRYFLLDPGHSVCAGLFLAIPPPELGDYVIAYDEIYQRQSDATKMAEACALKMAGHSFEDFIMDWRGGRQTPMGMSKTVMMIYRDAFQACGLRCIVRGSNFMWSDDNVTAGIERVRGWLSLNQNNLPKLRLYLPRTPHSQNEFGLYSMRIRSGDISDEPVAQNSHLMDLYRYGASANLKHMPPRRSLQQINPAYRAYVKEREAGKASRKHGGNFINLGPGTAVS